MATKAHRHSRRSHRPGRLYKTLDGQWLIVLLARTLATMLLMLIARWLHMPLPGGE